MRVHTAGEWRRKASVTYNIYLHQHSQPHERTDMADLHPISALTRVPPHWTELQCNTHRVKQHCLHAASSWDPCSQYTVRVQEVCLRTQITPTKTAPTPLATSASLHHERPACTQAAESAPGLLHSTQSCGGV